MAEGGSLTAAFGWLVGTGTGAGMALLFVVTGLLASLAGLGGYLFPAVRYAEDLLPDHDNPAQVQRGPAGTFVWLVGAESAAMVRPVETGLTTETVAVITKGLEAGEQVVTTGFARISDGARLIVRDAPASTPVGFVPPPRAKRGEKGDGGGEKGKRRREREGTEGRPAADAPSASSTAVTPQTSQAGSPQAGATR